MMPFADGGIGRSMQRADTALQPLRVLFTEVRPGYVRGSAVPPLQAGRKFTGAPGQDEDPADEA